MHKNKNVGSVVCLFAYLLFGFFVINQYKSGYNTEELNLYWALVGAYVICGALIVLAKFKHDLYLFEPFTFASLWYLAIFIYRPLQDLYDNNLIGNGVSVVSGGSKATILFTLGYICFYLGYYGKFRLGNSRAYREYDTEDQVSPVTETYSRSNMALIGWGISFVLVLICLISQGASLSYIFSLASSGEKVVDESNVALLFLSNFGITLVSCWMMVLVRPGKRAIKIVITILSVIYLIMRNGRWLLMVFVFAPFVYYYTKRKTRPNLLLILGGGFALLTVFAWMQYNRANIALGRQMVGFGDNWLTLKVLLSPFDSDFSTYKVFYNMVTRFPSAYPYMFGTTFLYTIVLFVPRVLWPGKPDNPVRDMIEHSMNNLARRSGSAVANIGEFYANFGIVGVLVFMFIFGKIISKLKALYEEPTEERLIAYSVLYPLLFQWVARGNFSGNFYVTIFAMLPFIVEWFVHRMGRRRV